MRALLSLKAWIAFTLLWMAFVAAFAYATWPRIPLDISTTDPVIRRAFESAVWAHLGLAAVWAALLPAMALLLGRFLGRARRSG